ncbi:MAG: sporulation protein YqfC [Oscillospiraceae bacterium]|nr:sporulation protein YqfC [Oscillospiraceae bacterium]
MGEQGQRRRSRFLERTAQVLDLPGDVVAGLPRVELVGDSELRMENHRGILAYGDEEIRISGGAFMIRITGQDMQLRTMNPLELLITGQIRSVELQ